MIVFVDFWLKTKENLDFITRRSNYFIRMIYLAMNDQMAGANPTLLFS
jgi:hypothetical protein